MAAPEYGDNPQQQALINLLLQDNTEQEQRQDVVYDRRDMGNDDAAPLPDIDWKAHPTKALASAAASSSNKAEELNLIMQFSNATPKATHRSDTWNKRIIDFFLVYCQFMSMYTSVAFADYFTVETLVQYAIPYLVIRAIKTKGIDAERIKARTLITWMDGLINGIWQYAHRSRTDRTSAAKEVLFKHGIARRIRAKVDQLTRVLGLSKLLRTKHILDLPDLLQIIDSALYDTRFSSGRRLAVIQFIMSWCIILYTGLRPMSLAASNKRYLKSGHYMRLRNIKIKVNAASDWTVIVNATELKGHVVGLDFKDLTFQLRCVKKTHNVMFCAATWIVLYLWLRGAFPQYKTLRELWTATEVELVIKPSMLDEPFLLAAKEGGQGLHEGKAATAEQISVSLGYYAQKIFMFGITAYALRRRLGNQLQRLIGAAHAAVVFGHKDGETVFNKHYSRGTADIDLVGLVTEEADVQPDKPGMYLDSTLHISQSLHALLAKRWWSEQDDTQDDAVEEEKPEKKAYGKNGENVKLTPEQDEACKPADLAEVADTAVGRFWVCFMPNGMKERNTLNVNNLFKGIESGKYALKQDIDPKDVEKYHTEAIRALKELNKTWTARRRQERKNIAQKWLAELQARPMASVKDREEAADILRKKNESIIERLVADIPKETAAQDIMTKTQMDATLEKAFQKETDDLGDVVDEQGRINPLPRGVLNKKFATRAEMDEMEDSFEQPFTALAEEEEQEKGEQPLVIDEERSDNGLEDDNDDCGVLPDDIITVRRELMELAATPILCTRDGRPIPGESGIPTCTVCKKEFKAMYLYKEHMQWVHSDWNEFLKQAKVGSKWKCAPCNKSFQKKSLFVDHALEHCRKKGRNQAWYAPVKEHHEYSSLKKKLERQRRKDAQETGPDAMERFAREILPEDAPATAREALKWGLGLLPTKAETHEQLVQARKELADLKATHPDLNASAIDPFDFDVDEALMAHTFSVL